MKSKTAGLLFVAVCAVLAILLFMKVIRLFASGIIFVIALVILGLLSRNFRKRE